MARLWRAISHLTHPTPSRQPPKPIPFLFWDPDSVRSILVNNNLFIWRCGGGLATGLTLKLLRGPESSGTWNPGAEDCRPGSLWGPGGSWRLLKPLEAPGGPWRPLEGPWRPACSALCVYCGCFSWWWGIWRTSWIDLRHRCRGA